MRLRASLIIRNRRLRRYIVFIDWQAERKIVRDWKGDNVKRLIFFVGVYDTLDLFTYELKREFDALGYESMIFDVRDMAQGLKALSEFASKPVKTVITFNNLGFNMELHAGRNLWEELNIPCINILMDHPFCYRNALDNAPANSVVLCTDRNHMRYLQRFYPRIPIIGYLPHAGKELPGGENADCRPQY